MVTVHVVFNAHIDPVWLWPWQSGVDTLMATCRSACDMLDEQPDLHFVKSEAWAYRTIERVDPELFERIRRHVRAGRWHVIGGWWLQPDCNGPSGLGLQKQIELGREYLLDRFGAFPRIGYNPDSFGHAATLPGLMRAAGQDRYIFMRPQEHELELPSRLFRWRGYGDGPEVIAFRIAGSYCTRQITEQHIRNSLTGLPDGIEHTMCFVGVGDHGGGFSRRQIEWVRRHAEAIEGCQLEFSSPERFFEAVAVRCDRLPVFTGELQMHSVGCYTVHRAVKLGVRRAEHVLAQADIVRRHDPRPDPDGEARVREAWRWVCFSHFHDTFGGSCIPSAYTQVHAQLGTAYAAADEMIQLGVRRIANALPADPMQRIALFNASDVPFDGYIEHEASVEDELWKPGWRILDPDGRPVAYQLIEPECLVDRSVLYFRRVLLRTRIDPGAVRALRIDRSAGGKAAPTEGRVKAAGKCVRNEAGTAVDLNAGELTCPGGKLPVPRLDLIADPTDTWTHEADRYGRQPVASARWGPARVIDRGPVMASLRRTGRIGRSPVEIEYRVYAEEPFVEIRLRVYWAERHKVLKMVFPLPSALETRSEGIPGGEIAREPDGVERPVRDRTLLHLAGGLRVGLVVPEIYALDATQEAVRLTLLRSCLMAHHFPFKSRRAWGVYADQGMHEFRIRVFCAVELTGEHLDRVALMMHRPPLAVDLTRGMSPM